MGWTTADIPDLTGKTYVVTGANTGLGFETAKALAAHGGRVILACRNVDKAQAAAARIDGDTEVRRLDLADLESVREFAAELTEPVDVLINNAGVMIPPLQRTAQGFELQFGVNVLAPFLLTDLLFGQLRERVVWLASQAHRHGRIDFDDPNYLHRRYSTWGAYGQSKVADLMLAFELNRRLVAAGSSLRSLAAHPGYAKTELAGRPGQGRAAQWLAKLGPKLPWFGQSAAAGALPELYAATSPYAVGGSYIGPDGFGELAGAPVEVSCSPLARDRGAAKRLWLVCEELVGQPFPV